MDKDEHWIPASDDDTETPIAFGPFELWPARGELRRDGASVAVSGRALRLLSLLVERAGQVVGRGELTTHLWPDGGVDDSSLRAHVAGLRKALGNERYILNVLGRGYIFVGSCRRSQVAAAGAPAVRLRPAALPLPLPLQGREQALALLRAEVAKRRLVSVVGAGGLGKTAVARAVAAGLATSFADGVCLVDLAPVMDASGVAGAFAAALGIAVLHEDPERALCDALRQAHLLIVVDNCDHLADAVAVLLERLLVATRRLHFLATSREDLCVQEEWVCRLAPLDIDAGQDAAGPAVRLFLERAAAAGASFAAGETPRILRLCRLLDGNPLAIGLAAWRSAELGLAGLEAGLDYLFEPDRQAPEDDPRHRSLDVMLDWSVESMAPQERAVLRRLAVFRKDFTLDLAGDVCSCARIAPARVVECILALSARSLVNVSHVGDASTYRLANTTRQYAWRRLMCTIEAPALLRQHAEAVRARCERADTDLLSLPPAEWRRRYATMPDELSCALDWCFSPAGDPMLGIELVAAACFVMAEWGRGDEHRVQVLRALRTLDGMEAAEPRLAQRLLTALTLMDAHFLGDGEREDAEWARTRLLALCEQPGALAQPVVALLAIAGWGLGQGRYDVVLDMAQRIASHAGRVAEPDAAVLANRVRAQALHFLGRHDEALPLAQAVLANAPRRRSSYYLTKVPLPVSMGVLCARTLWIRGFPDQARARAMETLELADGQHPHAVCMALGLGAIPIAIWRGDTREAVALAERFATLVEQEASAFWLPWRASFHHVLGGAGAALPANSVLRDLLATFDPALADRDCLRRVREGQVGWNAPEVLRAAAVRSLRAGGDAGAAARLLREAGALAARQGALGWELRSAISLAELAMGDARESEARQALANLLERFAEGAASADLAHARALLATAAPSPSGRALWCATLLDA